MGPKNVLPTLPHLTAAENGEDLKEEPLKNDVFSALTRRADATNTILRGLVG
jgi:hypothetical protein